MPPDSPDTRVEPASYADLLTHLPRLEQVTFTGDPDQALGLDRRCCGRKKTWARKTWASLIALEGYAQARARGESTSGFWHYCRSGIAPISHHQVSLQESTQVRQMWAEERLFPVPASVHPKGRVRMFAHIRIDNRPPAPRVYYLDRTAQGEGILVGYIGAHLTTTRT
ncbi:hypothetical protein [Nocardiopsis alba]|uniref:hypothetical protein n=1 Tax=Nocardiopsis alba TaxID=53437 RepID=UPI0033A35F3D